MKKGFTLIEILVVLILLAIIAVIAVPNVVSFFSENKTKLSSIQKSQIETAVNMYINDYCNNPISDEYSCDPEWRLDEVSGVRVVDQAQIQLQTLSNLGYLDPQITSNCSGYVDIRYAEIFTDNITCNFGNN